MQRISDSTISLGNDYNQPYASSYSAMTRPNMDYTKPVIVKQSSKSDIFHQMPVAESPKRFILDRNASTVFSSEPIPSQRPARKRSGFDSSSDIFYEAKSQNHYDAAPSAEVFYEPPSGHPLNKDIRSEFTEIESKESDYSSQLPALANFEQRLNYDQSSVKKYLPQQVHSDIFSDNTHVAQTRGRRHYNSMASATDIFNVSAREELPKSRNNMLSKPDWKSGSSFSNLFGGSAESMVDDSSRPRRARMEPTNFSRPSGLSSEDLNRERTVPKGRPTYDRSQDQFKSQIWF